MSTHITQKLAALGMALLMDGALVGAVALLISAPLANAASLVALWPSV